MGNGEWDGEWENKSAKSREEVMKKLIIYKFIITPSCPYSPLPTPHSLPK
jgi:hypothetical protein